MRAIKRATATNQPCDELAEKLYKQLCEASAYAGSTLRKHPLAPYSEDIHRLRIIVRLHKLIISQMHTGYDLGDSIASTRNKLGSIGVPIPATLQEAIASLYTYTTELRATIKEEEANKRLRKTHLDRLVEAYEASGDKKTAAIVRRIKRAEATKKVYAKCRTARGLNKHGGISYLLVPEDPTQDPKECENWRRVDCPDEIIALLQDRNQKHFGQSANCNLTKEPLNFTMEFTGACHRAEAMLDGTFTDSLDPPENMDEREHNMWELSKIFFEACQYVKSSVKDTIQHYISPEEYKGKIKAWDERTSTSPGTNMHLGHLKAYWARHTLAPDSPEAKDLENKRQITLDGHLILLNYALHFGRPYDSWKMVVNAMLEKDPGTPKIHRLRVIHLYEADYNLILVVKWQQLLHFACDNGFINPSHFGSVPGKEALDAVFIRELEYEVTRLTRKPIIHFDNDATSCYDRINACIANVVSRKFGQSGKVCMVEGRTLAEARYHLKTKLGVSDEFVQHCQFHPWFGSGQGAGDSPTKWLVLSSTLFDEYEIRATGALYESPDGSWSIQLYLVGFVDDVRNTINGFANHVTTMADLCLTAQRDCQLWHDLLGVVNQQLELPKCGYHAIEFEFLQTGEPKVNPLPTTELTLTDLTGNPLQITQWPNDRAAKY